jgi:2-methylcitrate dehydratase PrpD
MALGIAASHTGGLTANTGTMVKATHPGSAARHGVEAALLASTGFISNDSVIEARHGYIDALFGGTCDRELLTRDLGTTFQLVDPGFNIKHYPAQVYMQWPIEAALMVRRQHDFRPEDVTYVEMEIPTGRGGSSRPNPASGLDGKFSFEYCAAVALVEGQVNIASFSDATRFSPQVEAMLRKVRIKPNPEIPADIRRTWAVARVGLQGGREISEQCSSYRGAIANPMSREEHLVKVRDCASRVLGSEDVERTIAMLEELENLPDLRQLTAILNQLPAVT